MTTISVCGIQMTIPMGACILPDQDDLYTVQFDLLRLTKQEVEGNQYVFINPRRDGGRGFEKDAIQELYTDIQEEGLMFPLICRWVIEDGVLTIQVLDGERRWCCISRLIEKKEKCWSRQNKKWLPAAEVYSKVPCRILTGNDKEALKIAFMVSDRAVTWGEGATAKLIKKLRKCCADDEEILALTKKSGQWLREMDKICTLDDLTFNYLVENKINRAVALKLAEVSDLELRHRYLYATYADAVEHHQEEQAKANADLVKSQEKEEHCEALVAEAEERGDITLLSEAQTKLSEAHDKREEKESEAKEAQQPRGKTSNLRHGAQHVQEEDEQAGATPPSTASPIPTLRPGKIRKQLEVIKNLIAKGGKDENDKETLPIMTLHTIAACYEAIIGGEEDIMKIIRRQRGVAIIVNQRQKPTNPAEAQAAADAADENEED
jgi:hypothetical protein